MIKATIKFRTKDAEDWYITRDFNDEKHIDNFVSYIERKLGYHMDEVWRENPNQRN
jgi:hypothetical protein